MSTSWNSWQQFIVDDEVQVALTHPHLSTQVMSHGRLSLAITYINDCSHLREITRSYLGLPAAGPVLMLGGGYANGAGSFPLSPSQWEAQEFARLISEAHVLCTSVFDDVPIHAPFVPISVANEVNKTASFTWNDAPQRAFLDLSSPYGVDSPVKSVRKAWRKDLNFISDLGLQFIEEPLTREGAAKAAPLIANVEARNTGSASAQLIEWNLNSLLQRPSEPWLIWANDPRGRPAGVQVVRAGDAWCQATSIGLVDGIHRRGFYYQALTFVSAVDFALRHNASIIDYGVGHSTPKNIRGCKFVSLVRGLAT